MILFINDIDENILSLFDWYQKSILKINLFYIWSNLFLDFTFDTHY